MEAKMRKYRHLVGSLVSAVFVLAILALPAVSAHGSPLNLDEAQPRTEKTPIDVTSPLQVVWDLTRHKKTEIHVHSYEQNGALVEDVNGHKPPFAYEVNDPKDFPKFKLSPGLYQLKGWVKGEKDPWKQQIWVRVK